MKQISIVIFICSLILFINSSMRVKDPQVINPPVNQVKDTEAGKSKSLPLKAFSPNQNKFNLTNDKKSQHKNCAAKIVTRIKMFYEGTDVKLYDSTLANVLKEQSQIPSFKEIRKAIISYYWVKKTLIHAMKKLKKIKNKELKDLQKKAVLSAYKKSTFFMNGKFQKFLIDSKAVPQDLKEGIKKSDSILTGNDKNAKKARFTLLRKLWKLVEKSLLKVMIDKRDPKPYKPPTVQGAQIEPGIIETPLKNEKSAKFDKNGKKSNIHEKGQKNPISNSQEKQNKQKKGKGKFIHSCRHLTKLAEETVKTYKI
jgi:hypothetical protein